MPGTTVIYGHPVNDTDVDLFWQELLPPNYVAGQKYPFALLYPPGVWRVLSIGPHMTTAQKNMANNGYISCIVAYRTLVQMLPNQDGSASAQWPNQTNDCKMAMRFARADSRCNGKVVAIGGSSGGTHALSVSAEHETTSAWTPADRADCCVSLSGAYDLGDRTPVDYETLDEFVSANEAYTGTMDTAVQTTESLVTLVDATCRPTYFAHSNHDPMPFPQQGIMTARLGVLGVTNFVAVTNGTDAAPSDAHAFDNWVLTENDSGTGPIMTWIAARLAGDPAQPPTISGFSPESFHVQDSVVISGSNFTGASSVLFGTTAAQSFVVTNSSSITAVVAIGTPTGGHVTVITPIGSSTSTDTFTIEDIMPTPDSVARTPILTYPVGGLPPATHAPPAPPTNLIATTPHTISSGQVHLSWTPPNTDGITLLPYRLVMTGGAANVPVIPGAASAVDVSGLDDDTLYGVQLFSETSFGESVTAGETMFTSDPSTAPTIKDEPRGLLSLFSADPNGVPNWNPPNFWSNANVLGGRYRNRWSNIQAADANTYDWSDLDNFLAMCVTFGKIAGVSISFGIFSPTWLLTDPRVVVFNETGPDPGPMPVPWNTKYLNYIQAFYTAFAARYDSHPQLSYVVLSGMGQVVETVLCKTPDFAALTTQAQADGFTDLISAWSFAANSIVSIAQGLFRKTRVVVSIDRPTPDKTSSDTALANLAVFGIDTLPNQFGLMSAGLNALSNAAFITNQLIEAQSALGVAGFQYLAPSSNPACDRSQDPTPGTYDPELAFSRTNVAGATTLKGKYIEAYVHDATSADSAYITDIIAANALMAANPDGVPPPPGMP